MNYLAENIKRIVIETKEEHPKKVVEILECGDVKIYGNYVIKIAFENEKRLKKQYLYKDVKHIIIETDEDKPSEVALISYFLSATSNYSISAEYRRND